MCKVTILFDLQSAGVPLERMGRKNIYKQRDRINIFFFNYGKSGVTLLNTVTVNIFTTKTSTGENSLSLYSVYKRTTLTILIVRNTKI